MAAVNILSTRGLSKNFGGLQAVHDVNFELPTGQVRALIGPNGAGKSTFVSLLCGRLASTSGRIEFLGEDVTALPAHVRIRKGMAYTFQTTSVFAGLTVYENVALAVRRHIRGDPKAVDSLVRETLRDVGLDGNEFKIVGDLSYGHHRLVEIAMGLGQRPKLLILDEPTQGLSDSEIVKFNERILNLSGHTTILLIEHNIGVIMEVADYITVLHFGEVLAEGTPGEIQDNREVQIAYLGTG